MNTTLSPRGDHQILVTCMDIDIKISDLILLFTSWYFFHERCFFPPARKRESGLISAAPFGFLQRTATSEETFVPTPCGIISKHHLLAEDQPSLADTRPKSSVELFWDSRVTMNRLTNIGSLKVFCELQKPVILGNIVSQQIIYLWAPCSETNASAGGWRQHLLCAVLVASPDRLAQVKMASSNLCTREVPQEGVHSFVATMNKRKDSSHHQSRHGVCTAACNRQWPFWIFLTKPMARLCKKFKIGVSGSVNEEPK